jgi:hypothetical protein
MNLDFGYMQHVSHYFIDDGEIALEHQIVQCKEPSLYPVESMASQSFPGYARELGSPHDQRGTERRQTK